MRRAMFLIAAALGVLALAPRAHAHANYVGYSGAPGSLGECAASCHGGSGGTIQITGFPTNYTPGQDYVITIGHAGGSTIRQFNGSCRIGTGSQKAGSIAAGTNTITYSVTQETNGIHLSASSLDGGNFTWTAPPAGTGGVRLYIAGHQGSTSGANTELVLVANETQTAGVAATGGPTPGDLRAASTPNPFRDETTIRLTLFEPGPVALEIFDVTGRLLRSSAANYPAGEYQFSWMPSSPAGGLYFCRIHTRSHSETIKLVHVR